VATRKVKRFNDGGDAAGYGYGEGEGAAQGSGMGGYGSSGEGEGGRYANSDEATRRAVQEVEGLMRDVATSATSPRGRGQSLGANLATRSLESSSDRGSFAAPGTGDLGQFAGSSNDRAKGGMIKKYAKGGSVSASRRADGIAQRGKTKGRIC